MTVSSMLVQLFDLHQMLESVLYCCLEAVSAEATSVLLLNDDMTSFRIYQVEGPAKPRLTQATFTLLEDVAGYVMRTQDPVVISDAQSDPRFSEESGWESDFRTRSLIAVPLAIGEELIGVLEVLNKVDAPFFTQDERMLLLSIADEIASAIRNAKIFEFVANTYCKRRQGQLSCKGCHRPLGAWTPCIEHQEHTTVSGLWHISDMRD
jgi:sigma-B regulation protein RsbU (phosphoserine phosphatase)